MRLNDDQLTTLTYTLKRGIEGIFQLEENELAAEPLPDRDNRNAILLYEAAEGGAGVLHRLVSDPKAIRRVAERALEICHWRSRSGLWADAADLEDTDSSLRGRAATAACFPTPTSLTISGSTVAMQDVLSLLCRLARADAEVGSATGNGPEDAFAILDRQCGSGLERAWLEAVRVGNFKLPDDAQPMLDAFCTQPDFAYDGTKALIYVDGPHHQNALH